MTKNVDRMTAKERIKSVILNRPIDRVPFMPFALGYLAIQNGFSLYDFYSNPDLAFKIGKESTMKYPWANLRPVYGWGDHGAWEFGGKIGWPESNARITPYTPEPLISEPEEVDRLSDPDPIKTEWFQLRSHFNEVCIQNGFSAQLPSASIMAPLGSIVGNANLLKWFIKYPDAVHRLAEKALSYNIKTAQITIEKYGGKNCNVSTELPWESNTVISPAVFEEFCLPYISQLHMFYRDSGVRATMIHLCGDHRGNLKYWNKIPLPERSIFSIGDEMDLEEIGNFLGEKYILAGNISTTILQLGSKEMVKKEVKRCLDQAKGRPGGFILMPACEYPPLAPPENLEAVREALMEYGFF